MDTRTNNRTRFARRGHSRVAYDPGSEPSDSLQQFQPPFVLLHDVLADRSAWSPVREALSTVHRVIVVEARGHGASPTLANQWYTVGELAADVLAVLDTEKLSDVHFVGHGLGGATALEIAIRTPGRVRSLTLVDPSMPDLASATADARRKAEIAALRASDRAAADAAYKNLLDKALDTYCSPRLGPDWRSKLSPPQLGMMRRHAPALAALVPALDAYAIDQAAIEALQTPILLIASLTATISEAAAMDILSSQVGDVRRVILGGGDTGHRLLHEQAEEISCEITQFVEYADSKPR